MSHPLKCPECGSPGVYDIANSTSTCVRCEHTWKPTAKPMLFRADDPKSAEAIAAMIRSAADKTPND